MLTRVARRSATRDPVVPSRFLDDAHDAERRATLGHCVTSHQRYSNLFRKLNPMSTVPDPVNAVGWRPLTREQRRVIGVLVEKAKTTPEAYPMTVNAITTACNQKSNRFPLMELDPAAVETVLEQLREMGAVIEILGSGRTAKFRHNLYQWMGVDKVQLAVMAELLLRGQQTIGELRGRAARMEPIADLNELKPVLQALLEKRLIVELTPAGRGQMITHNLYFDREMDKVRELVGAGDGQGGDGPVESDSGDEPASRPAAARVGAERDAIVAELQAQVDELRGQLQELATRLEKLESLVS